MSLGRNTRSRWILISASSRQKGVDGYRSMRIYLIRKGYRFSPVTVHKYRSQALGRHSVVRPKKPGSKPGKPHKVFPNRLKQDFYASKPNQKWCTYFTYLFLKNGEVRYNCRRDRFKFNRNLKRSQIKF